MARAIAALAILFACSASFAQDWRPLQRAQERFARDADAGTRIIGGSDATIADNPWQVALLNAKDPVKERAQFCGGTVVSRSWIVTAAHCVDDAKSSGDIDVLANTARISQGGTRLAVEKIIINKQWNRPRRDADIALVKVRLGPGQSLGTAVPLEKTGNYPPGQLARISGWGATPLHPRGTDILQAVEVGVVSAADCARPTVYGSALTVNMLCIGQQGKDTCLGDSGGPATSIVGGQRQLVGITSFGFVTKCVAQARPGIYTRVAKFEKWVRETAKD